MQELDAQEIAKSVLGMLLEPPFSYVWDVIPYGGWASKALEAVVLLLNRRPDDVGFYLAPLPPEGGPGSG
jgi:hypothetical protein